MNSNSCPLLNSFSTPATARSFLRAAHKALGWMVILRSLEPLATLVLSAPKARLFFFESSLLQMLFDVLLPSLPCRVNSGILYPRWLQSLLAVLLASCLSLPVHPAGCRGTQSPMLIMTPLLQNLTRLPLSLLCWQTHPWKDLPKRKGLCKSMNLNVLWIMTYHKHFTWSQKKKKY